MPTHPGATTTAIVVKRLDLTPSHPSDSTSMILYHRSISTQHHHLKMYQISFGCLLLHPAKLVALLAHTRWFTHAETERVSNT